MTASDAKLAAIMALALMSFPVEAGQHDPVKVRVNFDAMNAQGDLWSARTAPNDDVFILCATYYPDKGPDAYDGTVSDGTSLPEDTKGICSADDGTRSVTCWTRSERLTRPIRGLTEISYIGFEFRVPETADATDYECTSITVENGSQYIP